MGGFIDPLIPLRRMKEDGATIRPPIFGGLF
jgi:hypothetical protein